MSLEYYAKKLITFQGEKITPGNRVPHEKDPKRDYRKMVYLGLLEARPVDNKGGGREELSPEVDMATVTPRATEPKVEEEEVEPTRQDLIDLLPEGKSLEDVEGTGANGYVTKADLEAYLGLEG